MDHYFNYTLLAILFVSFSIRYAERRHALTFIVFVIIIVLFSLTAAVKPNADGDGHSYFLATESLFNHQSPDAQEKDNESYQGLIRQFQFRNTPYGFPFGVGDYEKAKDHRYYGVHFWGYSLCAVPVKFVLHKLHLNELKALQLLNAGCLAFAFLGISLSLQAMPIQKLLYILLILFSPAFWYIWWPGAEIFSLSLVTLSLVFMSQKKWLLATVCAALGATQNQPILFLAVYYWGQGLRSSSTRTKDFIKLSLAIAIGLLPNLFYFIKFGKMTLLLNTPKCFTYPLVWRMMEMIFDPNIGIFLYLPVTMLIFFGMILKDGLQERRITRSIQLFLIMLLMIFLCTPARNWNFGTIGPTRHMIWMLPIVFYAIVTQDFFSPRKGLTIIFLVVAIIVQVLVVFLYIPRFSYVEHSPVSRWLLRNFPSIYNPSHQIFADRTLHFELENTKVFPIVYYSGRTCMKVLARKEDQEQVRRLCGFIPEKYQEGFESQNKGKKLFYINYK